MEANGVPLAALCDARKYVCEKKIRITTAKGYGPIHCDLSRELYKLKHRLTIAQENALFQALEQGCEKWLQDFPRVSEEVSAPAKQLLFLQKVPAVARWPVNLDSSCSLYKQIIQFPKTGENRVLEKGIKKALLSL